MIVQCSIMDYSAFIKQLDSLLDVYRDMQRSSRHEDLSDLPQHERQSLLTRCLGATDRIAGAKSTYSKEVQRLIKESPALHWQLPVVIGVVKALRDDLDAGYFERFVDLVHAEVFSDFLEMARHLNDAGYKDAAAVIAGSTLESHLRELASKNSIATADGNGRPIKADKLNSDLAKAGIYSGLDQKAITANLDLRNKAAHGEYSEYTADQVNHLIHGVSDFITRMPA